MTKKKTEAEEPMTAADLIQDQHNYRKHSETNKKRIRKSIDEAGLGRSVVVDADGVLIAGNGVQQVVDPDTPVRVIETDGSELVVVKRTDLHEGDPRRKTLALADNATSDDVEWDMEAIEADGWEQDELEDWGVVEMKSETTKKEGKNQELDAENFEEKIELKFELSIDEHAFVREELSKIDANKETALLKLLGYNEELAFISV